MSIIFCTKEKTQQGFTLFGLLLYITLAAIVLTVLGELTIGVLSLSARADRDRSATYTLLFLRAKIEYELAQAESILTPSIGSTASSLTFVREGETVTYSVSEGRLWKTVGVSIPTALTPSDVVLIESSFEAIDTQSSQTPIRWTVQTGVYNPLRAGVLLRHATTTVTWYSYGNV